MDARFTLRGDDELARKLRPDYLIGPPSHTLMANFGAFAREEIRDEAPEFSGDLKDSIDFQIDGGAVSEWVRVGSNLDYAEPVHEGSRPHMPPVDAVAPWALAHGIAPWALARSIARKGTRANPFVRRGIERAAHRLPQLMARMAIDIERRFGSG